MENEGEGEEGSILLPCPPFLQQAYGQIFNNDIYATLLLGHFHCSDFVTILRLASLQYITKLAMSESQKPRSPLPQNIK